MVLAEEMAVAVVFGVMVHGIGVAVVAAGLVPASEVVVAVTGVVVVVAVLAAGCDDCDLANPPSSS